MSHKVVALPKGILRLLVKFCRSCIEKSPHPSQQPFCQKSFLSPRGIFQSINPSWIKTEMNTELPGMLIKRSLRMCFSNTLQKVTIEIAVYFGLSGIPNLNYFLKYILKLKYYWSFKTVCDRVYIWESINNYEIQKIIGKEAVFPYEFQRNNLTNEP